MSQQIDIGLLHEGDCLLYGPHDLLGWVIAVKTWCQQACHVEIYSGQGMSIASRNGVGVNRYPFRYGQLSCVRRPKVWLGHRPHLSYEWFNQVARGQRYDWLGLLCFTLAVKQGARDRMFCSEFALREYREWNCELLNPDVDADHTAPSEFYQAGTLETIWEAA